MQVRANEHSIILPQNMLLSGNIWIRNERVLARALQFTVAG